MGHNSPPFPNPSSQALSELDYSRSAGLDGQVISSTAPSPPFQDSALAQAPLAPRKYGKKCPPQGPSTAPAWIDFLSRSSDDKAVIASDSISGLERLEKTGDQTGLQPFETGPQSQSWVTVTSLVSSLTHVWIYQNQGGPVETGTSPGSVA